MNDLSAQFTRRSALTATAAIAGGGLLAACGDGESATAAKAVDVTMASSKVPVGSGFVDQGNSVVVTQLKKGEFKAFTSICPHQGCQVGTVSAKAIVCPCHGSEFDPSSGAVIQGPADKALAAKKVTVQGANLHITG